MLQVFLYPTAAALAEAMPSGRQWHSSNEDPGARVSPAAGDRAATRRARACTPSTLGEWGPGTVRCQDARRPATTKGDL